ncbi:MAG: molybdopterin-dependent oxidoreductase, partial [Solirubrobacteraceae bacterium]
ERLLDGGAAGLLALADALGLDGRDGAGLIGVPDAANGRGLRESGVLPNAGPGLAETASTGLDAPGIATALASGELDAVYLLAVDPLRDLPDSGEWEAALEHATTVVAHAAFLTDGLREHATVIFPAESAAEKEGTVTHPDGRVQRLRPAIARRGEIRAEWSALAELSRLLGNDLGVSTGASTSAALFEAVPFYAGLTLEELAGHGVRWPERSEASSLAAGAPAPFAPRPLASEQRLRLGSYRSIWAAPEVEASPALRFLVPRQRAEISPADAARLGLRHGEEMLVVDADGTGVRAQIALRDAVPAGTVFLERGIASEGAQRLRGPSVEIVPIPEPEPEPLEIDVEEAIA